MLSNPTRPAPAPLPTDQVLATLFHELRDPTSATPFASECATPAQPQTPREATPPAQTFASLVTFQPRSTACAQDASVSLILAFCRYHVRARANAAAARFRHTPCITPN
jgi:hypothetical protein